jgi:signal transduction histidine kinase
VRARIRLALVLQAAAVGVAVGAVLLAAGLPPAAARSLGPRAYALLAGLAAVAAALLSAAMLLRWVGRPMERLLAAAARLGDAGDFPALGPPGEPVLGLSRAAVAFERTALALAEERRRLAAKVAELEAANAALAATREGLLRAERLASVGRLAAGVAHEVGNPLGAITGYADLARTRVLAGRVDEAVEFLQRVGEECGRIDTIVRDLLDFARPSAPALRPVALAAAFEDALRIARVQPRFREVQVSVEVAPGTPPVGADPGQLVQVLLNLLLNAADATGGKGRVRLAARAVDGRPEIEVADDGTGIAEPDLPRIFDPFFTTKAPRAGAGLGLAVCHGIVESFGGEIVAANGPGGGALFTIRLRAAEDAR